MRTASRFLLPLALGLAFLTSAIAPQDASARGATATKYTAATKAAAARKAAVRTGAYNMNSREVIANLGVITARRVKVEHLGDSPTGRVSTFRVSTRKLGGDGQAAAFDTVKVQNQAAKENGKHVARGYKREGARTVRLNPTIGQAPARNLGGE